MLPPVPGRAEEAGQLVGAEPGPDAGDHVEAGHVVDEGVGHLAHERECGAPIGFGDEPAAGARFGRRSDSCQIRHRFSVVAMIRELFVVHLLSRGIYLTEWRILA